MAGAQTVYNWKIDITIKSLDAGSTTGVFALKHYKTRSILWDLYEGRA